MIVNVFPCNRYGELKQGFRPCIFSSTYEALSAINKWRDFPFAKIRYFAISVDGLGYSVLPLKSLK